MASDAPAWASAPDSSALMLLRVMKDGSAMDQLLLSAACTSFGRNSAMCDVTLDHQSLSRKHALLCYNSHSVLCLCDLNSTHGTFLNGERVPGQQPLTLQEGDVLTFGASTRQYVVEKASTAAARASIPAPSEKEEEDFGPPLPPPPSASAQAAQGPGAGTGSSSSRSSMGPPPAPETIKFGSMGPPPAPSLNKEAERAELQAAIASMSQPVQYAQHTAGPAGQQLDKEEGGFEEEGEEEEGEGGGMPGLPTSFLTRKVVGSAGSGIGGGGVQKRPRPPQEQEEESSDEDEEDEFGPAAPPSALPRGPQRPLSSGDLAHAMGLPVSHEAALGGGGGSKAVLAAAFDPAGGRLATGSADYSLRLYDFGGMDRGHKPFREVTPHEGQPVRALAWSPSGDRIAVATAAANVKVFDREGRQQVATIKGDMYISDAVNTKGHQAGVTWVGWLPPQAGVGATAAHSRPTATLLSGSQDGTIRMWDLTNGKKIFEELCCSDVIKFKSVRGVKCGVTCAAVEPPLSGVGGQQQGARFVVAGLEDGSIHVVHFKAPGFRYTRSDVTLRDAHGQRGTEEGGGGGAGITCLAFSPDGSLLASRGMDGCVRVWRVYKEGTACTLALTDKSAPLASISGLASTHDSANVAWSPDGRLLLVGTSVQGTARPGAGEGEASVQTAPGCVVVLDVASSESACSRGGSGSSEGGKTAEGVVVPADKVAVFKVSLAERTTAVQVAWHPKLNQIAVSCSTGLVKVLYSPSLSVKGALLSSARAVKSRDSAADYYAAESVGTIYLPNALPMFSEDAGPLRGPSKKQRAEEMARTAVPPSGGGAGPAKPVDLAAPLPGAVPEYLTHAKRTFTEYFMQHAVKEGPGSERNLRAEDPQVVLTQYAARSAGAASHGGAPEVALYTRVYAATQPQAVLATKTLEEERDEWERAKAARLKAAQGGQQK